MSRGLYICAFEEGGTLSYLSDWRDAFAEAGFDVFNAAAARLQDYGRVFSQRYDVIVLGYSCYYGLLGPSRMRIALLCRLSRATVVGFLQNEFRNLADKVYYFDAYGIDILVSQLPGAVAQELYTGRTKARKIMSIYHGLFTGGAVDAKSHGERKTDVGSRLYEYAPYLGNYGRAVAIPKLLDRVREDKSFVVDWETDPSKRFQRQEWLAFLGGCRLTVACEAGNYFLQWSELKRHQINALVEKNPDESFQDIYDRYLVNDPAHFCGATVSPRHFDAVHTLTCQVLVEGRYNDIFERDLHYIELKMDGSNLGEVLERMSDHAGCEAMAHRAYDHVMAGHTLRHRVDQLMAAV